MIKDKKTIQKKRIKKSDLFQVYTLPLTEDRKELVKIGQLVFRSNDSPNVLGVVSNVYEKDMEITLFQPMNMHYILGENGRVVKHKLTKPQFVKVLKKIEKGCPGYIKWILTMNPDDWKIGCPL